MVELRRLVAAGLVASSLALTACGGPPTKSEYVAKMLDTVGDLDAGMTSQHIDPAKGKALITALLECQYDAIKDDDDLLNKAYDDPGNTDISVQLDTKSRACVDTFSSDMAAAAAAAGATTTTVPPADPTTTTAGG